MKERTVFSPNLCDTKLCGETARRAEVFFENRFFSDFAKNEVFTEAEEVFKNQIDDEQPKFGIWQGEFWGKQILSAIEVYKYKNSEELKKLIENSAKKVISYARKDGYIGSYRDSKNVVLDKSVEGASNWNIWGRKYTLWGLVGTYEITGNRDILDAAEKLACHLIDELHAENIEIRNTGTFSGMPSCSILKPMLLLYRHCGNKKILDFALHDIADNWEREDGAMPNLIKNSLSGKKVADWYPEPGLWAKAYEMMSCFEGVMELYHVTGDEKYFDAVRIFVDNITEHEKNVLGSVAFNDMFADAKYAINTLSEPCDSIHYMRLCYELYILTDDIKYMHAFESCYFNAFMAGLYHDWAARAVRSAGRHMWTNQAGMKHQHCCLNNMARAILRYNDLAVVQNEKFVTVNLFDEFFAKLAYDGGECEVSVSGGFFENKPVEISAKFTGNSKKLRVRIPHWCENFSSSADGKIVGGYFETDAVGDVVFSVSFDMKPKICEFVGTPCDGEWHLFRWASDYAKVCTVPHELFITEKKCTLTYGPLLLAKSKKCGNTEAEIFDTPALCANTKIDLSPVKKDGTYLAFKARFDTDGKVFETTLCDFASCANDRLDDDRYFCIYF